jgi:hypothetical protein
MKEQDYQRKIVNLLEENNAYTVKVITASKKGVPDIVGCLPITKDMAMAYFEKHDTLGMFIAVEVKTPKTINNTSKLQDYNLKKINEAGGVAIVAWSTEKIQETLECIYR